MNDNQTNDPSINYNNNNHIYNNNHNNNNHADSSPEAACKTAPNIEAVFQHDLSFENISEGSSLISEKRSSDLKNAKLTCLAREPSLNVCFPSSTSHYELVILRQPEEQHRARYLTEGSRGTVKDRSGQNHPAVKLLGYNKGATLQVFVGTDSGRQRPHGFYQACKVAHKNSTACCERDVDGTTVLELPIEPSNDMTVLVDCVGILKLRNADVEQRIGIAKSKKKSTVARLVFRVNIPKHDSSSSSSSSSSPPSSSSPSPSSSGASSSSSSSSSSSASFHTLQVSSTPIVCTQPAGVPEILKKSLGECSCRGGAEMFIIGKNFLKGTCVVFEEVLAERVLWSQEADIDQDFFQSTHLVCNVPAYHNMALQHSVDVQVVVHSGGRVSEPVPFTYLPCGVVDGKTTANCYQDLITLKRSWASTESEELSHEPPAAIHSSDFLDTPLNDSTLPNQPITDPPSITPILLSNDFPSQPQLVPSSHTHDSLFIDAFAASSGETDVKVEGKDGGKVVDGEMKEEGGGEVAMQVVKEEVVVVWPQQQQQQQDSQEDNFNAFFKLSSFSPAIDCTASVSTDDESVNKGFLKDVTAGPMDTADIMQDFNNSDLSQCILNEPLFPILLPSSLEEVSDHSPSHAHASHASPDQGERQDFGIIISTSQEPPLHFGNIPSDATCNIQESLSELKNLAQQVGLQVEQEVVSNESVIINKQQLQQQHQQQQQQQQQQLQQQQLQQQQQQQLQQQLQQHQHVDFDFIYQQSAHSGNDLLSQHKHALLANNDNPFVFNTAQQLDNNDIPTDSFSHISQSFNSLMHTQPPCHVDNHHSTTNHSTHEFSIGNTDDFLNNNSNNNNHFLQCTDNVNNISNDVIINSNNNNNNNNNNINNILASNNSLVCSSGSNSLNGNSIITNSLPLNAMDMLIGQESLKQNECNNASRVLFIEQSANFNNNTSVNNNSTDHPAVLYQLLATPNNNNNNNCSSSLLFPNLTAEDVNRVLSMSHEPS